MEEIDTNFTFNSFKQSINQFVVTSNRNSLISVIEVIVIEDHAHRQTLDNESWKILAVTSPLFLRVLLYELVENILTHKTKCLFLQVLWFTTIKSSYSFCFLLVNLYLSLGWCMYLRPHTIESIHIKRQIVELTFVVCHRTVCVAVKLYNRVHEIPYLFVVGMENVRTIFMHVNALNVLAIHITTKMWTFINNKHFFTCMFSFISKRSSKKTRTNNQIIVFHN